MKRSIYLFLIGFISWLPFVLLAQNQEFNGKAAIDQTNLLFVEGGTFNMGQDAEEDIVRRVTVSSFYIDATEVTNKEYRAFLNWLANKEVVTSPEMLPDTSIWLRCIGGEVGAKLAKDYLRLPAFDYYPVVGVSWKQSTAFARWRSDRQNEMLAIKSGYWTADLQEKYAFSTNAFLAGEYQDENDKLSLKDLNILLPDYRLLTEAEWEYAAWALIGRGKWTADGAIPGQKFQYTETEGKSKHHKTTVNKYRKLVLRHGKKHPVPAYYDTQKYNLPKSIFEGDINAYGAYNFNTNVAEWVQDVYRPIVKTTSENLEPAPYQDRGVNLDAVPKEEKNIADVPLDKVLKEGKKKAEITKKQLQDPNQLRVVKGASIVDEKGAKSPGNRYGVKASGQQERLIGFRCGMTRVSLLY